MASSKYPYPDSVYKADTALREHLKTISDIDHDVETTYPMNLKKDDIIFDCVNAFDFMDVEILSPTQISETILQTAQYLFPDTIGRYPPKSEVQNLDTFRKNHNAFVFDGTKKEWIIDTGIPNLGEISIPAILNKQPTKCYGINWINISSVNPSNDRLKRSSSTIATAETSMKFKGYDRLERPIKHLSDTSVLKTVSGSPRSAVILRNDRLMLTGLKGTYQTQYAGWEWRDAIIKLLANHQDRIKEHKKKIMKNGMECICLAGTATCGDHYDLWINGRADLMELEDFGLKSKTPIEIFDHIHFNMGSLAPLIHIDKKDGGGLHYLCLPKSA